MNTAQRDFLISYDRADLHWGEWIAEQLEKAGFTTVIQAWDTRPGENIILSMQQAMMDTKQTIAVLSEDYFKKTDLTQPSWAVALGRSPTGEERALIPVRVRPCKLEGFFSTILPIDLLDLEEDTARQQLLDGIIPGRAPRRGPIGFPGNSPFSNKRGNTGASSLLESSLLSSRPVPFPKNMPPITKTMEIFIVYSPKDNEYLETIENQLTIFNKQGRITTWNRGQVLPGAVTVKEVEKHWMRSQVILLLVSADMVSESFKKKMGDDMVERAIARHKAGTALIIPILLRPCLSGLEDLPFVLPKNKKPVTSWSNRHDAFYEIAVGMREVIDELLLSK